MIAMTRGGLVAAVISAVVCVSVADGFGATATWSQSPIDGEWHTAGNWLPAAVPNDPADIARFGSSSHLSVSVSADTFLSSIVFLPEAQAYTIAPAPPFFVWLSGDG